MDFNIKEMFKRVIMLLSSLGLLSTLGYYLINLENKTTGKPKITSTQIINKQANNTSVYKIGIVESVIDGDTIRVKTDGKDVTVRMLGIDTPETSHSPRAKRRGVADCFANEATIALKRLLNNKQVKLETDANKNTYDKYGRLLAYVFVNTNNRNTENENINVNEQMIKQGYAYEYTYHGRKYKYQSIFKRAQKDAEANKNGLWADNICK